MSLFYWITNTAVRVAILYYLRRIFATSQFRRLSMIIIVLCIVWAVPGFLTSILACIPMERLWNDKPGKCIDLHIFALVMTGTELALDIIIMVLPVREILKLQMSVRRKVPVSLVFLMGSFVIVTGIVRMVFTNIPTSPGKHASLDLIWLQVHVASGVVCACLPTYLPLLNKMGELSQKMISSLTSRLSTGTGGSKGALGNSNVSKEVRTERHRSWYRQMDESRSDNFVLIDIDKSESIDKSHSIDKGHSIHKSHSIDKVHGIDKVHM